MTPPNTGRCTATTSSLEDLLDFRGLVALVGAPDVGKTTLCAELANRWLVAGRRVSLLDCDLGQSEIGPPAAVGLSIATEPFESFQSLKPTGLEFVGVTAPGRNAGVALAAAARLRGRIETDAALVDTTGHVYGPAARLYKLTKLRLLQPDLVLAMQRSDEIEPLVRLLEDRFTVRRVPAVEEAKRKTPSHRTARRESRWAAALRGAECHTLPFADVSVAGCRWRSGNALSRMDVGKLARKTRSRLLWVETAPEEVTVVLRGPADERLVPYLQEEFGARRVHMISPGAYRNLLCGVGGPEGDTLAIGVVAELDFQREEIRVLAPLRSPSSIRSLSIGLHRVSPEGKDLGPVRPWSV